jgi:hypothetical protein
MEDDNYLLECNITDLTTMNGEQQEYWLLAIKAAREASLVYHYANTTTAIYLDIVDKRVIYFIR